jgi:hypothetical protein
MGDYLIKLPIKNQQQFSKIIAFQVQGCSKSVSISSQMVVLSIHHLRWLQAGCTCLR